MHNQPKLKAPFPYFGGKSVPAPQIWERLGSVDSYIEPFCGSAAVLLARPGGAFGREIINDMSGYVTNFWRAVKADAAAVAQHADRPTNECDQQAAHRFLCKEPEKSKFFEAMSHDVDLCCPRRAGLWVWGLSCWIGTGWCAGTYHGPDNENNKGRQVCHDGAKRPNITQVQGIQCDGMLDMLTALQDRLRSVMVTRGDWRRVVTPAVLDLHGSNVTAVFLDPPYLHEAGGKTRDSRCYEHDSATIAHDVREWALANGSNHRLRIALCGYEGEHDMPDTWDCVGWKALGGMANCGEKSKSGKGNNRTRERIWFSPHCEHRSMFT